jgi:hypothetical protein
MDEKTTLSERAQQLAFQSAFFYICEYETFPHPIRTLVVRHFGIGPKRQL